MLNDDRKTVGEVYACAGSSSNLKVEADRRTDADVLISAGLSKAVIGGTLLRLRTEYDSAERLRSLKPVHFPRDDERYRALTPSELMMGKLKALPQARQMMARQMTFWGVADAEAKAGSIIRWWLRPLCPQCHGTKEKVVPGSNRQSGRPCNACDGVGTTRIPHGQEGRRLANYLDECVVQAQKSIGKRLRNTRNPT